MKRIFLFLSIMLCSLSMTAQSAWMFNRGDSISWQPSQDMTVTFEKDPAGFFWQNIQTSTLDVVRMPIYTNDGITFADTPFLQAEKNHFEVTNDGNRQFEVKLKTNISDRNSITCQPQTEWLRLINTNGSQFPVITYTFEYDANYYSENREGQIVFKNEQYNLIETVSLLLKTEEIDLETECKALMALYYSTRGDEWYCNTNWGSEKPLKEWYGIEVNEETGHVVSVVLGNNNLNGVIPADFCKLPYLSRLDLAGNRFLTGNLPEEIGNLKELYTLGLMFCNLTGPIPESLKSIENLLILTLTTRWVGEIPEWIGDMHLRQLELSGGFQGKIPDSFKKLKNLWGLTIISSNVSGEIPVWIGDLPNLDNFNFQFNNMSGEIPASIGKLENLRTFAVNGNNLTGNLPETMANLLNLVEFDVSGNRLSGVIPEVVTSSPMWELSVHNLGQQEGYGLIIPSSYESTDYSKDGEVVTLQQHSKGNGIPIVITGSAFTDKDIADGSFQRLVNKAYQAIFDIEPYASFRDYFDVYQLTTVSKNGYVSGTDVAFDVGVHGNCQYSYNDEKLINYLDRIPQLNGTYDNVSTLILVNENSSYLAVTTRYSDGFSVVTMRKNFEDYEFAPVVQHEVGGHCIAKLEDEYTNSFIDGSFYTFTEDLQIGLTENHSRLWSLNVDFHKNPSEVLWKEFLENSYYDIEGLGVFEGGMACYEYGIYRPNFNSIMRYHMENDGFNAPSRWAIYQWIMKLAGEECKFEDFLAYDKKNLENLQRSSARAKAFSTRHAEEIKDAQHLGAKPIIYNYPSSEIGKHK